MIRRILRYLFPKRRLQSRLPLISRRYSSAINAYGEPPAEARRAIRRLMVAGVALTPADGWRLLREHQGEGVGEIIKKTRRKRHPVGRWRRAWRRFRSLW